MNTKARKDNLILCLYTILLDDLQRSVLCVKKYGSVDDAVTGEFAEDGQSRRENYDANKAMTGYTALHFACKFQKLRATAMLLDAGASVDAKTETGQTPLDLALAHATKKETKRKFQKLFKQFQQANEETQALEAKRLKDKEKAKIAEKGGEKKDEL